MTTSLLFGLGERDVAMARRAPGVDVAVVASNMSDALHLVGASAPSVVVIDGPSIETVVTSCKQLRKRWSDAAIVAFVRDVEEGGWAVLEAGANDFFVESLGESVFRSRLLVAQRTALAIASQRAAEADLEQFFTLSNDLLCVAGFDGQLKKVNPMWTTTFGWTSEELTTKPWLDFVHPDDREPTIAAASQLLSGQAVTRFTNRYRTKDGAYRSLTWQSAPSVQREKIYCVVHDVTDEMAAKELQAKYERRLILADRMASVGTLAAGVAHEINNPLACVMGNVEVALEQVHDFSAVSGSGRMKDLEEMLVDAREGTKRITKIVRGLKTFSRVEEERCAVTDLVPVLELSINMAFNEIRHRARLVKDYGTMPFVHADDARLGQVFINLLINAAQAMSEGSGGGNANANADASEIRILTSTDARGWAVVEVRDTGPGISAANLTRIFDPFFTTKAIGVGTGLGLAICHNIVTAMGGEISAHSELGKGATFRVALPGSKEGLPSALSAVTSPSTSSTAAPSSLRAKVLVIDDEPAVGLAVRRILSGQAVTVVTSATDALGVLADGTEYDVILSDLMMPGMSGVALYAELVRLHPKMASRVVFITGGAFTPEANAFLDDVPNERLEKPFSALHLRELVHKFVK